MIFLIGILIRDICNHTWFGLLYNVQKWMVPFKCHTNFNVINWYKQWRVHVELVKDRLYKQWNRWYNFFHFLFSLLRNILDNAITTRKKCNHKILYKDWENRGWKWKIGCRKRKILVVERHDMVCGACFLSSVQSYTNENYIVYPFVLGFDICMILVYNYR